MPRSQHISIATNERQLVLVYNSAIKNHREILAYAVSTGKQVHSIDLSKATIAATAWAEIADLLKWEVTNFIKADHATFIEKYGKDHNVNNDDAIRFLQKDPEMLIFPIIIQGERAKEVKIYSEVKDFFGPDSAQINIP